MRNEEISKHLITIKEDISQVKEHLKGINSKTETHERRLNYLEDDNNKIKTRISYWAGGVAVLIFIISLIVGFDVTLPIL